MNRDDQKNNLQKTASKKVEYRNRILFSTAWTQYAGQKSKGQSKTQEA